MFDGVPLTPDIEFNFVYQIVYDSLICFNHFHYDLLEPWEVDVSPIEGICLKVLDNELSWDNWGQFKVITKTHEFL